MKKIHNIGGNTQKPIRVGIVNKGGQGDRIYSSKWHSITLSATSGGTGSKTGLYYVDGIIRKLHPREAARLMGFPEHFRYDSSTSQALKQFGNSIVINVLQYIIINLVNSVIFKTSEKKPSHNNFNSNLNRNGSLIAKKCLNNEKEVINKFINWKYDADAREWLKIMKMILIILFILMSFI